MTYLFKSFLLVALLSFLASINAVRFLNETNGDYPLSTKGRWIVDAHGNRIKLACVNWYSAHMQTFVVGGLHENSITNITAFIHNLGFNCIRLPFSITLTNENPLVPAFAVASNKQFVGLRGMDVFDAVVEACRAQQIMIVMNLHVNFASWCCNQTDPNGLWSFPWDPEYNATAWVRSIKYVAQRYANQPHVIAMDIKNELHDYNGVYIDWGVTKDITVDFKTASEAAISAIHSVAPSMLTIVGGLCFNFLIQPIQDDPPYSAIPNKLVLTTHTYAFSVWWQYAEDGLEAINLTWTKMVTICAAQVAITLCIIVAMFAEQRERNIIMKANKFDFITGLLVWITIWAFLMILWTAANRYAFFYACCSYYAFIYEKRFFVIIPIFLLSIVALVVIHFSEKMKSQNNRHKESTAPNGKMELRAAGHIPVENPLHNGEGDVTLSNVAVTRKNECCHSCCHGRNPSCCAWTIIWGLISFAAYGLYIITLAQATQTYTFQQQDLESRWNVKTSQYPIWLGEFGTGGSSLWWNNTIQFLKDTDISWAYWAIDGERWDNITQQYLTEGYGLLTPDYHAVDKPQMIIDLATVNDFVHPEGECPYYA